MKALMFFGVFYLLCWMYFPVQGQKIGNDLTTTALKNLTITEERINGTEFAYNLKGERLDNRNRTRSDNKTSEYEEYEGDGEEPELEKEDLPQEETPDEKYFSDPADITLEHIDFVQLRLKHISRKTTSNITQLLELQELEFELNEMYELGWNQAVKVFNDSKRDELFKGSNKSLVRTVPEEYHIALIAYSQAYPAMYSDFNRKTREVCSGKDIDTYHYKSYFKLLILAIEALGKETKFRNGDRFLYRGLGSPFSLEIGQVLAFQQFVSTSANLKVAENFAGKTLFEVQGNYPSTAVSIKRHSVFEAEDEVLFSPFQVYQVESKHEGKYYTRYVLIGHDFHPGDDCLLHPRHNQGLSNSDNNNLIISTSASPHTLQQSNAASTIYNMYFIIAFLVISICKYL